MRACPLPRSPSSSTDMAIHKRYCCSTPTIYYLPAHKTCRLVALSRPPSSCTDMLRYLRDNNLTIDLETMNPVVMPKDPVAKMDAIFPKPAANVRAQYDLGASPKPSDFAQAMIVSTYRGT